MTQGVPVIITDNGVPVRPVEDNAPLLTVSENGMGTPITITDLGAPFVVQGLVPPDPPPPPVPGPGTITIDTTGNETLEGRFNLANPFMAMGVTFCYSGTLTGLSATHGGEPLTLVRMDAPSAPPGTIPAASALFIGNGLTVEDAPVVVTLEGGALGGPGVLYANDDYALESIVSRWSAGAAERGTESPNLVANSQAANGGVLVAAGAQIVQGHRVQSVNPSMEVSMAGFVTAGDPVEVTGVALGVGWTEDDGVYSHTSSAGEGDLYLTFAPVPNSCGVKVEYAAIQPFSLQFIRTNTTEYNVLIPAGGPMVYWSETMPGGGPYAAIRVRSSGDVAITGLTPLSSPTTIVANFARSAGPVRQGWSVKSRQIQSVYYATTAIDVHDGATIDWGWRQFSMTAGDSGDWIGYSNGDIAYPPFNPPVGLIDRQPTTITDLVALFQDAGSGDIVAVFNGEYAAELQEVGLAIGGFPLVPNGYMEQAGNTWLRFAGLPGQLNDGALYDLEFGP